MYYMSKRTGEVSIGGFWALLRYLGGCARHDYARYYKGKPMEFVRFMVEWERVG